MRASLEIKKIIQGYDVVVCGGGTAGFCAGIAAARCGAKTAIIEKNGVLGGTMTCGGVSAPALFHAHGRQIIRGIGWELMMRMADSGYASLPKAPFTARHPQLAVQINPFQAAVLMDEMASDAGVDVFFHLQIAAVDSANGHVNAVYVATPEGLEHIEGKVFIDCTGDGIMAALAGAEYELSEELQPATLNFVLTNYDTAKTDTETLQKEYKLAILEKRLLPGDVWGGGVSVFANGRGRGDKLDKCYALNPGSNLNHVYPFNGADTKSRSNGEREGRASIARIVKWLNRKIPGYENAYVSAFSQEVSARESRRIMGNAYITGDDYVNGICPEDSVCYSFYPIDLHRGDTETMLDNEFHEEGRVPGIPYGALVARGFTNLMMAGRIASGDRRAQSAYRVQASCMAMGEAAGTAAAMASISGNDVNRIDIGELKETLAKNNAIVPGMN